MSVGHHDNGCFSLTPSLAFDPYPGLNQSAQSVLGWFW